MSKINIDKCPICSSQEEKVTDIIIPLIRSLKFKKNSVLFDQGQSVNGFYLIHKGKVKISKVSPQGKEVILGFLGAGKTFGEASLFNSEVTSDLLTVTENSEIYFISKEDFQKILQFRPELYHSVISSLVRWMDQLSSVIENIGVNSARERVLKFLLNLQKEQQSDTLQLTEKKHEVAMMLGLRPETFSRTLADLEDEGLLKLDHRKIVVLQSLESFL